MLPAGVQYLEPAQPSIWGLPASSAWNAAPFAPSSVDRAVVNGQVAIILGGRGSQIRAAIADGSGGWRDVLVDPGVGVRGPGVYNHVDWLTPRFVAAGPRGFVVLGEENLGDVGHHAITRLGFAWFSADGTHWARTDFRSVLGSGAAFVPTSVLAGAAGWTLTGSLTSRDLTAKAVIVVLTSADGTHWKFVTKIGGRWGVTSGGLEQLGDRIVLSGSEWACDADGYMLNAAIGSPMLRLWSSRDGGHTWTAGNQTAGGVITLKTPTPKSAKGCTGGIGTYATSGSYLGVVNGRAVAIAGDHAMVATSIDLQTWQVGGLAGAVPATVSYQPGAARSLIAMPDGSGLAVLSLEARRDDAGNPGGFGSQVFAWTSADGTTWNAVAPSRPLEVTALAVLIPAPDGSVYLFDQAVTRSTCLNGCTYTYGPTTYRHSVAGFRVPTPACALAPGADCSFSTIATVADGSDLTGIDLYGSEIAATADLSGANISNGRLIGAVVDNEATLAGANLSGADLTSGTIGPGVHLAGANLADANLTTASIYATDSAGVILSGANLTRASITALNLVGTSLKGATLEGTFVNPSIFSADLSGAHLKGASVTLGAAAPGLAGHDFGTMSLSNWSFFGPTADTPGDMRGADFRHAQVNNLVFGDVDLTGAQFPAKARSQVDFTPGGIHIYFGSGVICPDGKPGTNATAGYDCRIGR